MKKEIATVATVLIIVIALLVLLAVYTAGYNVMLASGVVGIILLMTLLAFIIRIPQYLWYAIKEKDWR